VQSPLSFKTIANVPPAPESQTEAIGSSRSEALRAEAVRPVALTVHDGSKSAPSDRPPVLPQTMQRLVAARDRIHGSAVLGQRIRTYEVALDLDMSEFHFARQFRLAFDRSPHVYYDEVRADTARAMLDGGLPEGTVARRIGFRRPAELRALLAKRPAGTLPPDLR
jgi:transcriptional regulator GlxA family with amidase domain